MAPRVEYTVSDDEERNGIGDQFLYAKTVTALAWIARLEVGVELRDQTLSHRGAPDAPAL
jgi:hypothetical protein